MNNLDVLIETYRQAALVSAVLGGFAFTFFGVMLTTQTERSIAGLAVGLSGAASISLVVATFMCSFLLPGFVRGERDPSLEIPPEVMSVASGATILFYSGIVSLLGSIAVSGWLRSRRVGLVTTTIAILGIVVIFATASVLGQLLANQS